MTENQFEELVSRDLDGESSPEDRRRLEDHLERDPQARREYDELREVDQFLRDAGDVEPPRGLRHEILASLNEHSSRRGQGDRGGVAGARDWFARLLPRKYAYGLAASLGVALCVVIVLFRVAPGEDAASPDSLYGTMSNGPSGALVLAASVQFNEPQLSGWARVNRGEAEAVVEMHLESAGPVRVVLLVTPDMRFDAFQASDGIDHNVTRAEQEVSFDHTGVGDFGIHFLLPGRSSDPLLLRCFSEGVLLVERTLAVVPQ